MPTLYSMSEDIKPKHPGGRPTKFTQELADEICFTISNSPKGLKALCRKHKHWPRMPTIWSWRFTHPQFFDQYERAKIMQADVNAEEVIDIADSRRHDTFMGADGPMPNSVAVQRDRLRINARTLLMSQLKPKKYGTRVQNEITGKDGGSISIETTELTPEQRKSRLGELFNAATAARGGSPPTDAGEAANTPN